MAITSCSVYELFIFLSFFIFIPLPCLTINPKHHGLTVDLIHRDSPLSPLYNLDTTFWDKAEKLYESSIRRYAYITSKRSDKYRTDLSIDDFVYLAKFTIGEPAVDVFTIIDTGSDLLWIQCKPCTHCEQQSVPIYDRTKSTTYGNITCNSWDCKLVKGPSCDSQNVCNYRIQYEDRSYSYGFLATESLSFKNSKGEVTGTIKNMVFGCGINNHNSVLGPLSGVLGLAATPLSLVTRLHPTTQPKFSYCLNNASDPSSKGNLIVGEDSHISGFSTPFIFDQGCYQVFLVDIKMGSKSLDIPRKVFGSTGNVILDSGTTYTFLPPEAHNKVVDAISQTIKKFKVRQFASTRKGELGYSGSIGKDLNGFPTMTINFLGNAKLVLERWSIFIPEGNSAFCLSFLPNSGPNEKSVIGSMAQQFYNFGFDFATYHLSIIHSVCIY
ncbi:probable aspartic protease At2g35615 [Telopea speciosissima]|uniref:probable aspartic protease At2g35615 n=1 Tax=Telopea speciosissima TaxID=54955 RepID=UPI001CC3A29A|nr:probable aspartic protease At2g35615 [Telopea speciosissima]